MSGLTASRWVPTELSGPLHRNCFTMFEFTTIYFDHPLRKNRAIDLWMNPDSPRSVSLFFVHGGGWGKGSRENQHTLMAAFHQRGYRCASVDYRLNGVGAAEQLEDVRMGLAIFHDRLQAMGEPPRIVLIGSSAGAHLALLAGLAQPGQCGDNRYQVFVRPAGIIAISAPVTLKPWTEILPEMARKFESSVVGCAYSNHPERFAALSPETYLHEGASPMFMISAGREHLFPNELVGGFVERGKGMGVDLRWKTYPDCEHGFFYDIDRRCQKAAFEDTLEFLDGLAHDQGNGRREAD